MEHFTCHTVCLRRDGSEIFLLSATELREDDHLWLAAKYLSIVEVCWLFNVFFAVEDEYYFLDHLSQDFPLFFWRNWNRDSRDMSVFLSCGSGMWTKDRATKECERVFFFFCLCPEIGVLWGFCLVKFLLFCLLRSCWFDHFRLFFFVVSIWLWFVFGILLWFLYFILYLLMCILIVPQYFHFCRS